ncbi:MAG: hypothetical protein S4CHLAM45_03580 [Chlamydiales bacterium]|nr:hypothetical protein [Chlamydiales bacterium]MCH9619213.1 hypothetical protein [Chlamydiales bacterium]MCH9622475.1 hypothetical protein [Chlamydiales bacterium]
MYLVYLFSGCLIVGMLFGQLVDMSGSLSLITFFADICLSFIMMEVGLEFVIYKEKWKSYFKDYFIAALAAGLPWIFCFIYFYTQFSANSWEETLLIARFAAPTSSGILFSMLTAAGLGLTWVFKKVEILAILDDIDTILFLIPLQFLLTGGQTRLMVVVFFITALIYLAWKFLHKLHLPAGRLWLFFYSILLVSGLRYFHVLFAVELEILLPAFVVGCVLFNPHDPRIDQEHKHEHAYLEVEERPLVFFERGIKSIFMVLVGLSLPQVILGKHNFWWTVLHVVAITIISNLGKCAPMLFYRKEASLRKRAAVSVGMFSRGEVGAGILVLAIEHGAGGYLTTIAGLSLALNLILTGFFIWCVIRLIGKEVEA